MGDKFTRYQESFGIQGVFVKIQPSVHLFTCPLCGIKHEREEVGGIGYYEHFCEKHERLARRRNAILELVPEQEKRASVNLHGKQDPHDHIYWLKKHEGLI